MRTFPGSLSHGGLRALAPAIVFLLGTLGFMQQANSQQPSFNCVASRAPDEIAICGNFALSLLDRELSDLYGAVRDSLDPAQQPTLREGQRNWLRQRVGCGSDPSCIVRLYQQRIAQPRTLPAGPPAAPGTPAAPTAAEPPRSQPQLPPKPAAATAKGPC